jgi:hypothetical protein
MAVSTDKDEDEVATALFIDSCVLDGALGL